MRWTRQQGPGVLLVAVIACSVVLFLEQKGFFAHASEDWLQGEPMRPWQYAYQTAVAFISAAVCAGLRQQSRGVLFIGAVMFLTGTLSIVLKMRGFAFEPLSGWLAAALAGLGGLWIAGSERGGRVRAFREFFVGRLREDVFSQLVLDREPVKLSGQREASTVTCRILNLAELSDKQQAFDVEQIVSLVQEEVGEKLIAAGGYLEVSGPGNVVAHFGFPVLSADHVGEACSSAIALRSALEDVVRELRSRWDTPVEFGIGVACGKVTCGLMGYEEFQRYGLIGASVEQSAQLSEMNRTYGSRLLISPATQKALEEKVEVRPVEIAVLSGMKAPGEVYEVLGLKGELTPEQSAAKEAFWKGVVALRGGQKKAAREHFEAAKVNGIEDRPLDCLLKRAKAEG